MINFFRRIRKKLADDNKPLKYARYAIGEILLLVIGILIALQINNWNEQRKSVNKEKGYVRSIYEDLQQDLKRIDLSSSMLTTQYNYGVEVLKAIEQKENKTMDSISIAKKLGWDLSELIPVMRENNTWDDLKVKGIETYIIKDSLSQLLDNFYANYDQQIERFNQLPQKVREDLRILTGYCHDSEGVVAIFENGVAYYGSSSPSLRHCIISNVEIPKLVSAITVSAIVNINLCKGLKQEAEAIERYMEYHFKELL